MTPERWTLPLGGLGWRVALDGRLGPIGSLRGAVETRLKRPRSFWLGCLPWRTGRLCLSLQTPGPL